jgi:hypothetical protein
MRPVAKNEAEKGDAKMTLVPFIGAEGVRVEGVQRVAGQPAGSLAEKDITRARRGA